MNFWTAGRGEKLERWGDKILVRPDPQAIWNTPRTLPELEGATTAGTPAPAPAAATGSKHSLPERWTVRYREPDLSGRVP